MSDQASANHLFLDDVLSSSTTSYALNVHFY